MRTRLILLIAVALPAFAQSPEVQRALIERDQQSQEFAVRLRNVPLEEQQRLENVTARQLLDANRDRPPELRPYERQDAARETERFVLRLPPPAVRIEVPEELRPRLAPIPPASE